MIEDEEINENEQEEEEQNDVNQGPNSEQAKDEVKELIKKEKKAKEAVQKVHKVSKNIEKSNKVKAAAKFASGAKKFAILANPYFWIALLVILALIVLIGIIMSFTIMPSNFMGKTKKFVENMMQGFCGFLWGDNTSPISNSSEDVKDLANYIQNMGYDIQGYGFGDVEYTDKTKKAREDVQKNDEKANAIEGKRNYVTEEQATQGGEIKKIYGLTAVTTVSSSEFEDGNEMYRITGRFSSKNNDYLRAYLSAEAATYTEATYSIKGFFNELGDSIIKGLKDVFGGNNSDDWEDPGDVGAKAKSTGMLNFTNMGGNTLFNSTLSGSPSKIRIDPKKRKIMLYEKGFSLGNTKFQWGHTFSVDLTNWTAVYGRPLELFLALHLSSMMPDLPYQIAVDQAFNTKVNITLQDVKVYFKPEINIDGHDVNINGCDLESSGDTIRVTDVNGNRFTAKMDEKTFNKIKDLISEAVAPNGVIYGVLEGYSDTFINTSASGYRATQAGFCDGEYMVVTQNEDHGHEDSNHGGRIAWYSMSSRNVEHELLIGEEGGHMEGFAYDWDRHMILKQVEGTSRFIQVDNETRDFANPRYCTVSVKCRQYTFDKNGHQLIGIGGSTLYFFKYNSSKNNYDTIGSVPLQDYHLVCGNLQGIGTDGLEVYLADSDPDKSSSLYRVYTYDFTGRKTGEYTIGGGFGGQAEVETLSFDNDGNLWVLMPGGWFKAKPLDDKGIKIKFPYIESVTNHWYYHTIDFLGSIGEDTPYGAYKRARTAQKVIKYADEDAKLDDCEVEITSIITSGSGIFYQVCEPYLNEKPNIYLKKIFHGIYYKYDGTTETARKISAARAIEAAYGTDNYNNKKFEKDPQKIVDKRIKYNWHSEGSGSSKLEVNLEDATEYVNAKKAQIKIREESDALITLDNEDIEGAHRASVEGFLNAAKEVTTFVDQNNFVYGHAENMPPKADGTTNADGSKKISCDRLVAWALHKIGFTDQPACGLTVREIPAYGDKHGWKRINNENEVQAGDIVLIGTSESTLRHTFICAGKDKRYDCGSDARIRLEDQYSGYSSQPFNEPIGADFVCAYRPTSEAEETEMIKFDHDEAEAKIKEIGSDVGVLEFDELGEESPMCKKLVDFKSNKSNTLEAFSILENVNSEAADVNYRLLKKLMIEMDYFTEDDMNSHEKNILLWPANVEGIKGENVSDKINAHYGQTSNYAYKTISDTTRDSNDYGIIINNFMENSKLVAPGDAKIKQVGSDEHGNFVELEFTTLTDDKVYPLQGHMMLLHQDDEKDSKYNIETPFDQDPEYSAAEVMRRYRFKDTYQVFENDDVVGITMRISGLKDIKVSAGSTVLRGQEIAGEPKIKKSAEDSGDEIYITMKRADKTKIENVEDYINPSYTYEDEKEMSEQLWYLDHPEHGNKYDTLGRTSANTDYVEWALKEADNPAVGYCQTHRYYNENSNGCLDVDCSAFVYYALLNNNYDVRKYSPTAFTTGGGEQETLRALGFIEMDFPGPNNCQAGDILWKDGHTEIYSGDGKSVGAHGADNLPGGHPSGGTGKLATNGDQTGGEVSEVSCSSNWTKIYRPQGGLNPSLGPGSGGTDSDIDYVQWAINIANDDRYYYDHSSSPWTFSCSTFVASALYRTGHLPNDICPPSGAAIGGEGDSTLHNALRSAGFQELSAGQVGGFEGLQPGDIFTIGPSYHVAIYAGNGQAVSANGPDPSSPDFDQAASITTYDVHMGELRTVFRK